MRGCWFVIVAALFSGKLLAAAQNTDPNLVRPGTAPNTLIVFNEFEVSAPPLWSQKYAETVEGRVYASFQGGSACLVFGYRTTPEEAKAHWGRTIDSYAMRGKVLGQDKFVEDGIPVRVALVQYENHRPEVLKLSVFPKASFLITTFGVDSPQALKRNDQAFYFCTVRPLPPGQ